LHQRVS